MFWRKILEGQKGRGKLKCKNCRYEFAPKVGGINLTASNWKALLKWFLRCQSVSVITEETGISKYKILKALNLVRQIMAEMYLAVCFEKQVKRLLNLAAKI